MRSSIASFGRAARALGAGFLVLALLAPTLADASVLCGMSGRTYAQRCPCAHDEPARDAPARIEGACCAPVEVGVVDAPRTEPERAAPTVAALPSWSAVPAEPSLVLVGVESPAVPRAVRPPSTGPPAHLAFGRYLS